MLAYDHSETDWRVQWLKSIVGTSGWAGHVPKSAPIWSSGSNFFETKSDQFFLKNLNFWGFCAFSRPFVGGFGCTKFLMKAYGQPVQTPPKWGRSRNRFTQIFKVKVGAFLTFLLKFPIFWFLSCFFGFLPHPQPNVTNPDIKKRKNFQFLRQRACEKQKLKIFPFFDVWRR